MLKGRIRLLAGLLAGVTLLACGRRSTLDPLTLGSAASPPDAVTIVIKNYRPQTGGTRLHLFVSNFSARLSRQVLWPSSARDGMGDDVKAALSTAYGFNVNQPESGPAGFADLMLFKLGIVASQQNTLYCGATGSSSSDVFTYSDARLGNAPQTLGLRDCAKQYLNLNPNLFDNAGNGIPDYLKMRCGLNLTNASDAFVSTAGDGVANIDKCKQNIPIDEMAADNAVFAYQYSNTLNGDGSEDLTIANIPVVNGGDQNFVAMYVVEQNLTTSATSIYTAFAILKTGYVSRTVNIPYWAVDSSHLTNQQFVVP